MRTKEQTKQYNTAYYEKHKEKVKAKANQYYKDNTEKVLETVEKYRNENRELLRVKDKAYYRRSTEVRMLGAARHRAKTAGMEFNIEREDIKIPKYCPLLGVELKVADGQKVVKYNSPSLDRIDSSKGYIKGNVWVISMKANSMKSNSSFEEFFMMATRWKTLKDNGMMV